MARAILSGAIRPEDAGREWRAQIERCLASGLRLRFLNSHEHMHMLPALFPVATALAKAYDIPHIRFPTAQPGGRWPDGSLFRGAVMKILQAVNRRHAGFPTARFIGLEASGKIDLPYLERSLSHLEAGQVYELMCHPGEFDAREVTDARLLRYHDWEGELTTLTSPAARELLDRHRVQLIGYRHLEVRNDRLVVRPESTESLPLH